MSSILGIVLEGRSLEHSFHSTFGAFVSNKGSDSRLEVSVIGHYKTLVGFNILKTHFDQFFKNGIPLGVPAWLWWWHKRKCSLECCFEVTICCDNLHFCNRFTESHLDQCIYCRLPLNGNDRALCCLNSLRLACTCSSLCLCGDASSLCLLCSDAQLLLEMSKRGFCLLCSDARSFCLLSSDASSFCLLCSSLGSHTLNSKAASFCLGVFHSSKTSKLCSCCLLSLQYCLGLGCHLCCLSILSCLLCCLGILSCLLCCLGIFSCLLFCLFFSSLESCLCLLHMHCCRWFNWFNYFEF